MFGILLALLKKKRCTLRELADKFEVSTKTISRHALSLEIAGVPIISYSGKGGGLELENTFSLDSSFLTSEEQQTLLSLLNSNETFLDKNIKSTLIEKLSFSSENKKNIRFTKGPNVCVDMMPWYMTIKKDKKIEEIKECCFENKKIEIEYEKIDGSRDYRIIDPYIVIYKENAYYLYAYCEKKANFRLFKICRIKSIKKLPSLFEKRSIDYESKPWNNPRFKDINLTLKYFNDSLLPELDAWLNDYKLDKENRIITTTLPLNNWLINKIISFDGNIKVLSPSNVVDEIKNVCNKIYNLYA